ncbi:MAG: extracellular solute-binding protein, partial [Pseudonocardia sp.]
MKIPRRTGAPPRPSRWAAIVGAAALVTSLAACSSGPEGIVVNLYGGASGLGFDKIIANCNEQAAGRYTIVGNLLPSDADGQRDQFVRRLAAQDAGMDLLGMDVTWTAEFAEAGWIRELNPEQAAAATKDTLQPPIDTATWKDKLYGIPRTTNVQLLWYRKSLVPNP